MYVTHSTIHTYGKCKKEVDICQGKSLTKPEELFKLKFNLQIKKSGPMSAFLKKIYLFAY